MRQNAKSRVDAAQFDLEWLGVKGEEVPLDDNSIGTVLPTYTLRTIPGWHEAVKQMRRVWWNKIAAGCHLTRIYTGYVD